MGVWKLKRSEIEQIVGESAAGLTTVQIAEKHNIAPWLVRTYISKARRGILPPRSNLRVGDDYLALKKRQGACSR